MISRSRCRWQECEWQNLRRAPPAAGCDATIGKTRNEEFAIPDSKPTTIDLVYVVASRQTELQDFELPLACFAPLAACSSG